MSAKNLSEELFKPRFKHPETSSLVRQRHHLTATLHSTLEGESHTGWYRMLNRLLWSWRGLSPLEIGEVLARIAASRAERTSEAWLDTVIGYRGGNWIYEWSKQAAFWQQKAQEAGDTPEAGQHWLHAVNLYSLAAWPHIKGDELAEQAQILASRAYEEATLRLDGELKELTFSVQGGSAITGFLHMPPGVSAPYPTVLLCGSLDSLQIDNYRLFHDYLAPRGIAMLTIDMPSVGFSSKWKLTQDTSFLHQQVLRGLDTVPWVDHTRVAALGYRFGANVAVRLAFLEAQRLRGVATLGPIVHALLANPAQQTHVPDMYIDVLASRLGMAHATDETLSAELNRYSLKTQGLLGRRTPTPMLAGYWQNDPWSPEEDARLIVNSSASGKLLPIGFSPVLNNFDRALQTTCDWLLQQLK
ncbi:MAG: esterase FrsA [Mixta calida]|uniref:Esterase FrsA n=3 Tax=Mixta calida TaxID=665913 RepID=A0ABN5H806_9GAMM|nr:MULTISPECIES: esterase FrsA [Mixta]AIX74706.1 fermentation/respiration switch protein [Pantoea sp. PSNIH2]MDU3815375.1 esterase FrsA [Pantoea sp.]POU49625.1 esterase FrsA [Pantoea sp. PSNIH5]POU62344.1 esterase FrsA [Pantoea sp. PSNIH4]POY66309.1 esterase FrsA [Pantoea sp. PSNIH3]HCW48088.1 esterase FrsA [Erwiniaceae bacterium]